MKKPLLLLSFLIVTGTALYAQTYNEKAAEVQKMVWASAPPEFNLKDVPGEICQRKRGDTGTVIYYAAYIKP
jgi:hypothetical protein